jgi:AraC-type DNA-binding domain-containing proteins
MRWSWCLAGDMPAGRRPHTGQHPRVIAKFEDFLATNQYEPVHSVEICKAIGCSERTLRNCCHEYFGMGPIHYLLLRRMHLARRALLAPTRRRRLSPRSRPTLDSGSSDASRLTIACCSANRLRRSLRRPPQQVRDARECERSRFMNAL